MLHTGYARHHQAAQRRGSSTRAILLMKARLLTGRRCRQELGPHHASQSCPSLHQCSAEHTSLISFSCLARQHSTGLCWSQLKAPSSSQAEL